MAHALEQVQGAIRRHGLAGSLRRAAAFAGRTMAGSLYCREGHIWYHLDLRRERPRIELPAGLELLRADASGLTFLEQLPTIGLFEARQRLAARAALWIVHEDGRAAFACWIFHDRTPVLAARTGWLDLPPDTVCLEDSVTSPYYRGRGVAPAAWSAIAHALSQEGLAAVITKVDEGNLPCQRALEKAGFRALASMNFVRVWPRSRVEVRPQRDEPASAFLVDRLAREPRPPAREPTRGATAVRAFSL